MNAIGWEWTRNTLVAILLAGVAMVATLPAGAHDLQTVVRRAGSLVVVEATYEGEEAASFLAVSVKAPDDGKPNADAFQTGRTDLRGNFVFLPSRDGIWSITLDDEMGHRVTEQISIDRVVAEEGLAAAPAPNADSSSSTARSSTDRLVIGLSIVFGISGMLMGWLAQKRKPTTA